MFAGLSLFYPDVVIGRPGARCDALEAQSMIVSIPGARRCYQRTWRVDLGCKIYVHNLRDCAKMDEMLKASDWLLRPQFVVRHTSTLSTSSVTPRASALLFHTSSVGQYNLTPRHYPPRAWALLFHTSRHPPHTSSVATNDCSGKHAVSSGTQSSGPVASRALGPCK